MKDMNAHTLTAPGSQSGKDWSAEEKAKLKELAPRSPRKAELLELFPDRTLGSIKVKLAHTRRELDLPKRGNTGNLNHAERCTTMLDPDDEGIAAPSWQDMMRPRFAQQNARFLAALQAA